MKHKKLFLILSGISLVLVISLIIYVYKEYNRKPVTGSELKSELTINSQKITEEFSVDEPAASKKYSGKVIEVEGLIKKIETNEAGFYTIILGDSVSQATVRCSIDSTQNKKAKELSVWSPVKITGICTGFIADDLGIGSDVIFSNCILDKK